MPVEHAVRAGLKQAGRYLGRKGGKVVQNLTWDDAVKGLQHQTREALNVSKITNNGELLPSQVKLMEDTFTKNTEEGLEFLEQFEDGILNNNWNNFGGHLSDASRKADQDFQGAAIQNSRGMEIDPKPDPDDLLPLGPWPLKKSGEGVFEPEIDESLSKSLLAANSQKDLVRDLKTPLASGLREDNMRITAEELVSSGMFDRMLKRQGALEEQSKLTKDYRADFEALQGQKLPEGDRSFKRAEKNFKSNNRDLMDLASLNLFTKHQDVFKINRDKLKSMLSIFGEGKKEWHHTFFQNKAGGNLFLNKISQDPLVAANLMLKLKDLNIATSGVMENLSLLDQVPHNELHQLFRKKGLESWYDANAEMFRGGELDITDYIQEIGQAVAEGRADINEMFDILDVYSEVVIPYLKQQTEVVGKGPMFKDIEGLEQVTKDYASDRDIKLDRKKRPKRSKAPQKVVPAPPKK
tara:strand:+ start:658 stop:2055 length:1398 start_codon:yes stop_codon:yes gene_type:complete